MVCSAVCLEALSQFRAAQKVHSPPTPRQTCSRRHGASPSKGQRLSQKSLDGVVSQSMLAAIESDVSGWGWGGAARRQSCRSLHAPCPA
eukprot:624594-Rhodomonas_salina.1